MHAGKKRWMSDASPLALSSSTVRQECLSLNLTQLQCIIVSSTLSWLYLPAAYTDRLFYLFRYMVLPPFLNIRFYIIIYIYQMLMNLDICMCLDSLTHIYIYRQYQKVLHCETERGHPKYISVLVINSIHVYIYLCIIYT